MSGKMVLSRAETAGVRITRNGDRLSVACRGELPPDIRDGLRQHKAEILDLIAEPWWGMGFPAFLAEVSHSPVTIYGSGRSCCHCGLWGGDVLRVAIPEGIFPVHRSCVDDWYAALPPYRTQQAGLTEG
jgi:TubC N-terminal docking domain